MLLQEQAAVMLDLQSSMNAKVDPNWVASRYPYLRAVVIEGSEAIEHHGWKWWKKQDKDLPQLQMELIDIWHFLLSEILLRNDGQQEKSLADLTTLLHEAESKSSLELDGDLHSTADLDLISKLELLIALAAIRRIELALFAAIMADCKLSWNELYCQYVGKNVLNMFRQDHGYKEGNYQKIWDGREDNEFLVDILTALDSGQPQFKEEIYAALQAAYPV